MKKIGYIYQSFDEEYIDVQFKVMREHFVEIAYSEDEVKKENYDNDEVLKKIVSTVEPYSQIVIYELRCLGKSITQLVNFFDELREKNIQLVILNKGGTLNKLLDDVYIDIVWSIANQEKKIISNRTTRGIRIAQRDGKIGGRPKISKEKIDKIYYLYHFRKFSVRDIAEICNVSIGTAYKYAEIEDK